MLSHIVMLSHVVDHPRCVGQGDEALPPRRGPRSERERQSKGTRLCQEVHGEIRNDLQEIDKLAVRFVHCAARVRQVPWKEEAQTAVECTRQVYMHVQWMNTQGKGHLDTETTLLTAATETPG